jgi:hypothetical protein
MNVRESRQDKRIESINMKVTGSGSKVKKRNRFA